LTPITCDTNQSTRTLLLLVVMLASLGDGLCR
jgi:hypothetical protein